MKLQTWNSKNFRESPPQIHIWFLLRNVRKFTKFGVSCPKFFSNNFSNFFWNFSSLFQNKKNVIFVPKLVKINILMKIWPNFSIKLQKWKFLLRKPSFSKFLAPLVPKNLETMYQKSRFWIQISNSSLKGTTKIHLEAEIWIAKVLGWEFFNWDDIKSSLWGFD